MMFDFIMFILPLMPMAAACIEDFRSKEGEFWNGWLYMTILLAAFWKILAYPDTLLMSAGFACLTMSIGLLLERTGAWSRGDALFWGMLGFILPTVDITWFFVSGILCLLLAGIFDKLILEKWGSRKFGWVKGSSHALWVIPLVYIVYWVIVII